MGFAVSPAPRSPALSRVDPLPNPRLRSGTCVPPPADLGSECRMSLTHIRRRTLPPSVGTAELSNSGSRFVSKPLFTIGHSNRRLPELLGLLEAAGIQAVRDVRRFPRSRANPHFNLERLEGELARIGIEYRHAPALGGRRTPLPGAGGPNGLWREPGFRGFADYALGEPFREEIAALCREAEHLRLALLCSEAVWWRCHRRIIADYLLLAGIEVFHILGAGRTEPARLTDGAEPRPDGVIGYPLRDPKEPTCGNESAPR